MEYYSFIAGLPDIQVEDTKASLSLATLKADIKEQMNADDLKELEIFFYKFDNQNLCSLLFAEENNWSFLGTLNREDMEEFIAYAKDNKIHQDDHLPPYFAEFISAWQSDSPLYSDMSWEDQLTTLYYTYCVEHKSKFIKAYFEFNLNLQNVIAAFSARQHGLDVNTVVVGQTEVSEQIRSNNSKDFGIAAMFPHLEEAIQISELSSPLVREQRIDALRWLWLEEQTVFNYFTKERIFAYLLQLEMLERWLSMDKETGTKAFSTYVKALVDNVKIDIVQ